MKARLFAVFILGAFLSLGLVLAVNAQGAAQSWIQVNTNGFGDQRNSSVSTLAPFGGQLYAGTYNWSGGISTAQLWRSSEGMSWTAVMTNGFGNANNRGINHLFEFNSNFYASTINQVSGGEVWRSGDGITYTQVVSAGFGDRTNAEVFRFVAFNNTLYASTTSYTTTHGGEVWRSTTGNFGEWTRVVTNGFGDVKNIAIIPFEVFSSSLYAGTWNGTTGGEVWHTSDGAVWTQINSDGFGDSKSFVVSALSAFNGYLYASVGHWETPWDFDSFDGIQIWRCQVCDGSDWTKVVDNSFWPAKTGEQSSLQIFGGRLYLVVGNPVSGMQVWHTSDGSHWEQVGFAGFGNSNNIRPRWDNSVTVFSNRLFIGTENSVNGGEVWLYLPNKIFLPVVIKQ